LSTQEQYHQLQTWQDHLEQRFDSLNTSFGAFSDHFSMIYLRPVPPPA
jgi:hypothetical protein